MNLNELIIVKWQLKINAEQFFGTRNFQGKETETIITIKRKRNSKRSRWY